MVTNARHHVKNKLSDRETEILSLIVLEHTTSEIAKILSLSRETIKTHRKHLFQKLHARNVAGLVRRAFEYQILSLKQGNKITANVR